MNQHELKASVKKHCGRKMEAGEKICDSCVKKLNRARKIEWQTESLWRIKRCCGWKWNEGKELCEYCEDRMSKLDRARGFRKQEKPKESK